MTLKVAGRRYSCSETSSPNWRSSPPQHGVHRKDVNRGPQMIGIKNLGSRQLETRDLGDSLHFVLKRNPRRGNSAAGLIVIAGFTLVAWWRHGVILMVFLVV